MKTPRRPRKPKDIRKPKDGGAALVMVLWGAVVMSIIAAAAAQQATTSAVVVNAGAELTRARALADGGVRAGWSAFAEGQIDSFSDTWACRHGEDTLLVQLRPETARIDINVASVELLTALFAAAGADRRAAAEMAEGVVAYRQFGESSEDDGGGNEVEGEAEEAAPQQLTAGQFLRGPFQTIEELGYVPGIDVGMFRAIADDVSVHSRTTDISLPFASANVREAVEEVRRTEGLMVGASAGATISQDGVDLTTEPQLPPFEGSLLNVRAIGVTGFGAVFVRDAVVEGPIDSDGRPLLLRYVQGRLRDGEVLPDARGAQACAQGFTAIRRGA